MSRVEILSGRERRRIWSDEQKRAIVDEALMSGLTMAAVARRHDIVPQQIYTWRREFCAKAPTATSFLPVVLSEPIETAPGSREPDVGAKKRMAKRAVARIEIRCTNGRVKKVEAGVEASALKALIRSVEDA